MKKIKLNKKLVLKKISVANLNEIKGGVGNRIETMLDCNSRDQFCFPVETIIICHYE